MARELGSGPWDYARIRTPSDSPEPEVGPPAKALDASQRRVFVPRTNSANGCSRAGGLIASRLVDGPPPGEGGDEWVETVAIVATALVSGS